MTTEAAVNLVPEPYAAQQAFAPACTRVVDQRETLAKTFPTLGVGVHPSIAYQRTKQWYGSSGAEWTYALRKPCPARAVR